MQILQIRSYAEIFVGKLLTINYVPPTEGGDILFLVRIPSASAMLRFRALSFEPMDGF